MRHSIVPIVMQEIKDSVAFADYDSKDEGFVDSLTFLYAGATAYGDPDAGTGSIRVSQRYFGAFRGFAWVI